MASGRMSSVVDFVATLAMGIAAVMLLWGAWDRHRLVRDATAAPVLEDVRDDGLTVSLEGAFIRGSRDAALVVVEFSDFECPFCGRFARDTFGQLERDFIETGKVRYAFRHFPLQRIHAFAMTAARAADCAGRQDRFWEMRTLLFDNQRGLGALAWSEVASQIGVDGAELQQCLANVDDSVIRTGIEEAKRLGVVATPTFLIGENHAGIEPIRLVGRINGARSYADFRAALEGLLPGKASAGAE